MGLNERRNKGILHALAFIVNNCYTSVSYCMICASVRGNNLRVLSNFARTDAKPCNYLRIVSVCICTLCIALYLTLNMISMKGAIKGY